jgi:HTH-type transcriptional regulator/antitoxin HigA
VLHELSHVHSGDGLFLDIDLINDGLANSDHAEASEHRANAFASDFLVPKTEINDFVARTAPLYSRSKIVRFANRIKVHPGIVVGQLQYRKQLTYAQHRRLLEKVRHVITQSALTDGWGNTPP